MSSLKENCRTPRSREWLNTLIHLRPVAIPSGSPN
jgi:hypothetical protein